MGKITIQEIATKLTDQNGLSKKEATLFVNMMFETIREAGLPPSWQSRRLRRG